MDIGLENGPYLVPIYQEESRQEPIISKAETSISTNTKTLILQSLTQAPLTIHARASLIQSYLVRKS